MNKVSNVSFTNVPFEKKFAASQENSNRSVLSGSQAPKLQGSKEVGNVDPNQPITVSIMLRRAKHLPPLKAGQTIPPEKLAEYGANPRDLSDVDRFAKEHHLKVVQVDQEAGMVKLQGKASDLSKAFGVELKRFRHPQKGDYITHTNPISLPNYLKGKVQAVIGLNTTPFLEAKSKLISKAQAQTTYMPSQLADLYQFPKGDGSGQTVAIIELGGGYKTEDLQNFFKKQGVPMPNVTAVSVDGGQNSPEGDPNSADAEVDLDIEVAGAIAPKADYRVYFAPNSIQGFVDAINQAVKDKANIISISWGAPESQWSPQDREAMNRVLQNAAAAGVTVFAAAGDNGSDDGVRDGKTHADYPASNPYVVGCGGTKLESSNGKITNETVWNEGAFGGATGGAPSNAYKEPAYQKNAGLNLPGRGVCDLSGNADPYTGYDVVVDGTEGAVGGTSAVAPLMAGLWARINQNLVASGKKPAGYINPAIYSKAFAKAFYDITQGNNGAFQAKPGYDYPSGLGRPIGDKMLEAFLNAANAKKSKTSSAA
jgi:kumamolisin